jgi:hypothetical protein
MLFDFVAGLFLEATRLVAALDAWQQVLALVLVGAVPFLESYLGSFLGTILGVNPFLAVPAAVLGNVACTFLLIAVAGRVRGAVTGSRREGAARAGRRGKIAKHLERFGVPGVCLLGPIVVASQITAPTLIALGARRSSVLLWSAVSIVGWGVLFGFFGEAVASWLL